MLKTLKRAEEGIPKFSPWRMTVITHLANTMIISGKQEEKRKKQK
jgi:hypothetical protein